MVVDAPPQCICHVDGPMNRESVAFHVIVRRQSWPTSMFMCDVSALGTGNCRLFLYAAAGAWAVCMLLWQSGNCLCSDPRIACRVSLRRLRKRWECERAGVRISRYAAVVSVDLGPIY